MCSGTPVRHLHLAARSMATAEPRWDKHSISHSFSFLLLGIFSRRNGGRVVIVIAMVRAMEPRCHR